MVITFNKQLDKCEYYSSYLLFLKVKIFACNQYIWFDMVWYKCVRRLIFSVDYNFGIVLSFKKKKNLSFNFQMKEYEPSLVISPLGQLLTLIWPFDLLTQTAGTATTPLPHSLWEPLSPSYWPQVRLRRSQVAADSLVCLQDAPPGAHYGQTGSGSLWGSGGVVWCGVVSCRVRSGWCLVSCCMYFFFFILTSNRQMDKHAADAKSV